MSKRALPLLTGGLNELTRSDLIENSQLQQCDNYEVIGDGTLHRRKDPEQFDSDLDDFLFTAESGLFWEDGSSIISISEPYYLPTDIDLSNKAEYESMATDYILLVYGEVSGVYELHVLYKVNLSDGATWTNSAEFASDGVGSTLPELLSSAGITYTSNSDPQFVLSDDKIIITDNVNNAHFVAIDKDGFVRVGKLGLPAPRNRPEIEQMTSVETELFETASTQTYISTPGLVQVAYTAVTKFGDESNPSPLSPTLDMQYQKINADGTIEHYLDKIKVFNLTVPDVPENINETLKYFNFYIRVIPYKSGSGVYSLTYSEQQEIVDKTIEGKDTGNSYVLTIPPAGGIVSYENDVAPIAKTAAYVGGITMLGNVQSNIRFPWSFKYFHPITINNTDTANYIDANMIIRLYDKDTTYPEVTPIENFSVSDFLTDTTSEAIFTNTPHFRIFDQDLTTPLYVGFSVATNQDGSPVSFETGEYVDLIIQVPYLTANSPRTIYLCWNPQADQGSYAGVSNTYNDISAISGDTITYQENFGIHYGSVLNINQVDFRRQSFFKGAMIENSGTYLSYPIELASGGLRCNRVNVNNKIETERDDDVFVDGDIVIHRNSKAFMLGFNPGNDDNWAYIINTSTQTVDNYSLKLNDNDAGIHLHGDQFNEASLSGKAGYISFWLDLYSHVDTSEGSVVSGEHIPYLGVIDGSGEKEKNYIYNIATIWGQAPAKDPSGEIKALRLFIKRYQPTSGLTGAYSDCYMYLDDYRIMSVPDNNLSTILGWTQDDYADKVFLGEGFKVGSGSFGSTVNATDGVRYMLMTWDSDQSKVSVWSYNGLGEIHSKTVEWDFNKITDGSFGGVTLGATHDTNQLCPYGVQYNDIQLQIGEYLDPSDADSYAKFSNIVNQFPAYDNILGFKNADSLSNISYNNNISFSETEATEEKERKNMVRWSDVNYNSFPDLYFKTVREPVLRVVPAPSFLQYQYQNTFLIYTRNSINRFVLEGSASGWQGSASSLIEEKTQYGLFAPETLVRVGDVLLWLSEVGVVLWDKDALRLISKNIINVDLSKEYFAYENSVRNQYILCQKYVQGETQYQYVFQVDRGIWSRFIDLGKGGITASVSMTGGSQTDNVNLMYQNDDNKSIIKYPGSSYTSDDSVIKTKEMFFEKGVLRKVKAGYTGEDKSFSTIITKDDASRNEITRTHEVAMDGDEWRGVPLGYNRGKSVVFQVDNADTIESIIYDLDIQAEVIV